MISAVCATSWNRCRKRTARRRLPRVESFASAERWLLARSLHPCRQIAASSRLHRSARTEIAWTPKVRTAACPCRKASAAPGCHACSANDPKRARANGRSSRRHRSWQRTFSGDPATAKASSRPSFLLGYALTRGEMASPVMISTAPNHCHAAARRLSLSAIWVPKGAFSRSSVAWSHFVSFLDARRSRKRCV